MDTPNLFNSDQIASGNNIRAVEPDLTAPSNTRIGQQNVRPNAVKSTALGPIVTSSHSGTGSGAGIVATVPTGFSINILFTLTDNKGRAMLAVPDVSVYVPATSTADITAANQWPNAVWGGGTLPVYVMNDWGRTDNSNVVTRVVVRNNGAINVSVIVVIRWRVITQPTNQPTQAGSGIDFSTGIALPTIGGGGGHL